MCCSPCGEGCSPRGEGCNTLSHSGLAKGEGCNTLSHSGLANVYTRKIMFYPLNVSDNQQGKTLYHKLFSVTVNEKCFLGCVCV